MKETHGSQDIEVITGRKIIVTSGKGKTNVNDLTWLRESVLARASHWKNADWAYVADCTKMEPVGPEETGVLIEMTKAFVDAGCKAFGFAEGKSIMLKVQAQKNTQLSKTGIPEGHFATVDEALDWLKTDMQI